MSTKKDKIEFLKKHIPLSDSTLTAYLSWINRLCRFSGKAKSTEITVDDISEFRQSLTYLSPRSQNVAYAAINTIYKKVLWHQMPEEFHNNFSGCMRHRPKQPRALPLPDTGILKKKTIRIWIDNIEHPMYHLVCSMLYATGLKLSEICILPFIALKQDQLQVGNRTIPIPENIRKPLRRQKRNAKKNMSPWLFPSSQNPERHISGSAVQKILQAARPDSVAVGSGVRTLRASFIIHQLEDGTDPNWLAYRLGLSGSKQLIPYMKLGGWL